MDHPTANAAEAPFARDQVFSWASDQIDRGDEHHAERAQKLAESKLASIQNLETLLWTMCDTARGNAESEASVGEFLLHRVSKIFSETSDSTESLRASLMQQIWERATASRPAVGGDATAIRPPVGGDANHVSTSQLELILQQQTKLANASVDAMNALVKAQMAQTERQQHNSFLSSLQKVSGVAKPKTINVFECDLAALNPWVDYLLHYVQHVDIKSKPLVDLIVQLRNCTYSNTDYSSENVEERQQQQVTVTNMAEQNFSNMLSQLPPDQREEPKEYAQLDASVRELDYQMYGYTISLIHQGAGEHSAECLQYKDKVQGEGAFASFVELILSHQRQSSM